MKTTVARIEFGACLTSCDGLFLSWVALNASSLCPTKSPLLEVVVPFQLLHCSPFKFLLPSPQPKIHPPCALDLRALIKTAVCYLCCKSDRNLSALFPFLYTYVFWILCSVYFVRVVGGPQVVSVLGKSFILQASAPSDSLPDDLFSSQPHDVQIVVPPVPALRRRRTKIWWALPRKLRN